MLPDFGGSLLFFVVLIFVIKGEGCAPLGKRGKKDAKEEHELGVSKYVATSELML